MPDWLRYRATASPGRDALIAGGRTWSFSDLDADVCRTAHWLARLGTGQGDRVATLLHNGPAAVMLAHSLVRLGATLVPLNYRLSDSELAWQLHDCGAPLLIVEERTSELARRACGDQPEVSIVAVDTAEQTDESPVPLRFAHDPDFVTAIIYTSGTTGRPKGAMLTFGNFWWSAIGSALNIGTRDDDRWLACLPLFHIGGLSIIFRAAICGFAVVIHDGFDADAVNRAIDDERITIVSVVAMMLAQMLDARIDRALPSSLRCVLLGGGSAPRTLLAKCASAGIPVVQTYGMTETTSQIATLAPEDALPRPGAAGRPLYPNEIRIVRDDGSEASVNEAGEILARGPVVMAGYAGQPEATALAIVDGWLRTGDIARIDADGYLYVLDRRDDLIITGGENVYPAEVEAVLLAQPLVTEAAVIGEPDEKWGQRVVAIVRIDETAGIPVGDAIELLRAHCSSHLARYKLPGEFRVVAEPLPRTASGKLRRAALREITAISND